MKILALLIVISLFGFTSIKPGLTITNDKVILVINNRTSIQDLKDYKKELWEKKGITFDFNQLPNGADQIDLTLIKVDCHDGFRGEASTVLKRKGQKLGFYRDYQIAVDSPFGVGNMKHF